MGMGTPSRISGSVVASNLLLIMPETNLKFYPPLPMFARNSSQTYHSTVYYSKVALVSSWRCLHFPFISIDLRLVLFVILVELAIGRVSRSWLSTGALASIWKLGN